MRRDDGQATPLLALVLVLAAVVGLAVAQVGLAAVERGRAQAAADAAALAGVVAGRSAAEDFAAVNGAVLVEFTTAPGRTSVVVRYRRATARATAELPMGADLHPPGGGDRRGLAAPILAALARADSLLDRPVPVVSGFRSRAEQEALWANRASNPYPVAAPGSSDHERGMAVDVPAALAPRLAALSHLTGLCQPLPQTDPVHFVPCLPTGPG